MASMLQAFTSSGVYCLSDGELAESFVLAGLSVFFIVTVAFQYWKLPSPEVVGGF